MNGEIWSVACIKPAKQIQLVKTYSQTHGPTRISIGSHASQIHKLLVSDLLELD